MKVLLRRWAVKLQAVIQRIRTIQAHNWELADQRPNNCKGRLLCRCYSCKGKILCRCYNGVNKQRIPRAKPESQDVHEAIYKTNHKCMAKMFSPLLFNGIKYYNRSEWVSQTVVQKRWLTYFSSNTQPLGRFSSPLLASKNCSLTQIEGTERKGFRSGRDKVGQVQDEIINPIDRLQQFLAVPLLPEKDYVFKPSQDEITEAKKLFIPSARHNIEFLKSAVFEEHLPDYDLPEVAFIGRSNVGKSSLIKALLSHTDVFVSVSKNPGHTKLLNFFKLGKKFTLVDMPGYGYNMPQHYTSSVETFLMSRKKLCRTFMLVDSAVGITETDVIGLNMLEEFHIPYVVKSRQRGDIGALALDGRNTIVLTKIDKTRQAVLLKSFMTVLTYRNKTQHCFQQPFLVSSMNGEGVALLQTFIAYVTGCVAIKGL